MMPPSAEPPDQVSTDPPDRNQDAEADRRKWERDPANQVVLDKMWLLQAAFTREIQQTENDAIPRLQATSSSAVRDAELRRLWRWLAVLKADERKMLSTPRDKLHSVVD